MSLVNLSEVEQANLMQRKPYATITDLERNARSVRVASRPLLVYVLHVSRLSGRAVLSYNPRKGQAKASSMLDRNLDKHHTVVVADKDCKVGVFFIDDMNAWQSYKKQNRQRKPFSPGELALVWPARGGDEIWEGATVLEAGQGTLVRPYAEYCTADSPQPSVFDFFDIERIRSLKVNWTSTWC